MFTSLITIIKALGHGGISLGTWLHNQKLTLPIRGGITTSLLVLILIIGGLSCGTTGLITELSGEHAAPAPTADPAQTVAPSASIHMPDPTSTPTSAPTEPPTPVSTQTPLPTDTPDPTPTPKPTQTPTPAPTGTAQPTNTPRPTVTATPERAQAQVVAVVDGDTIRVNIGGEVFPLRYIGIDSPEPNQRLGADARAANEQLVSGQTVYLEKDISETDQYGRLLRYVYLANGTLVNAELVRRGYAQAISYEPDTKRQSMLEEMEQEARHAQRGLWQPTPIPPTATPMSPTATPAPAADTPAPSGQANVVVAPSCCQFDSPGNDNYSKDQEYVCFANTGSGDADMTGWKVRDEHGWTYTFPTFVLSPGAHVRVATGCGNNTADMLFWCKDGTAVWNNGGDTVFLYDDTGTLVAQYSY